MKYGVTILLLVALCASTRAEEDIKDVMEESLPAYTVAVNADILNATGCRKDLEEFRDAIDRRILWSIKMLDSSGIPSPGFVFGNNYWLGQREGCMHLNKKEPLQLKMEVLRNNSRFRKADEENPPFETVYFAARFTHNSTVQYQVRLPGEDTMILGLCLPISCSTREIGVILEKIFQDRTLLASQLYSADYKLVEVKDLRDSYQWLRSGSNIFIIFLVAIDLMLVIVGTLYDVFVFQKRLEAKKMFVTCENNNTSEGKHANEDIVRSNLQPESRIGMIIISFSIYTNTKSIFSTKVNPDSIPILHGVKFFGMVWIIMIHTIYYGYAYIDNVTLMYHMGHDITAQVVSNSTFSVDTFFFVSGFLTAYLYFMREKTKKMSHSIVKQANQFFMLVLKRFLRLTPTYMMVVALAILNFSWYRYTSPFAIPEKPDEVCMKYWWRNLLYINNLFDRETMCLSWSWYISSDMQFYMFGCFLLMLSSTYFYSAIFLGIFSIIGSILINGYLTYVYKIIPTYDEVFQYLALMYDKPWLRIAPYMIGIGTAYLLTKSNSELHLKKTTLAVCWILGIACNLAIIFGTVDRQLSLSSSIMYTALSRTVWSISIAWLVIACCTNNAGIVTKILAYKAWIPLSKLTYSAYLLNPFLINSVYLHGTAVVHVEFLNTGALFLGLLVCTYICSYALSLMIEAPSIRLLKLFLNPNRKST